MNNKKLVDIINELKKFDSKVLDLNEPLTNLELIYKFEITNKVILPNDYKEFIKEINGFSLMGIEVYGVLPEDNPNSLFSIYDYEHNYIKVTQYDYLVPFSPDGGGNFYCFDTRSLNNETDICPIVFWVSNYEYTESDQPEIVNADFLEFIQEVVIEWTLEDYDYNGNEK